MFSVAQYVRPKSSGQMDAMGLQITTAGTESEKAIAKFKNEYDSESALYLQGLCDRVAEDAGTLEDAVLREVAGRLDFSTFYGRFKIDPDTGCQIGRSTVLVQWQQGRKVVIGQGQSPMVYPWRNPQ